MVVEIQKLIYSTYIYNKLTEALMQKNTHTHTTVISRSRIPLVSKQKFSHSRKVEHICASPCTLYTRLQYNVATVRQIKHSQSKSNSTLLNFKPPWKLHCFIGDGYMYGVCQLTSDFDSFLNQRIFKNFTFLEKYLFSFVNS